MIPTVIIVNDDNPELESLGSLFFNFTRTLNRTSIQGEQLYGMFEGVLYCDQEGNYALKRRDNYDGLVLEIVGKLNNLNTFQTTQLKEYLDQKNEKDPRPRIHFVDKYNTSSLDDANTMAEINKFINKFFSNENQEV